MAKRNLTYPPATTAPAKSWNSAIAGTTQDRLADEFVASLAFDHRLLPFDIKGSIAHARMLETVGLITKKDRAAIEKGLAGILDDYQNGRLDLDPAYEDIHMLVEAKLIERIGEPGRRLHTARSRNDQVALDIRLWMSQHISALLAPLHALLESTVAAAHRHLDHVALSFTHLQQAQPVCGAAPFLAYVEMIARDEDRFLDLEKRCYFSPLGSGAVAGSTLNIDRAFVANLLSADLLATRVENVVGENAHTYSVTRNSIDSTATRDLVSEFVFGCAQIMVTLSRMAEDFIIWMSQEFAYLTIDDAYTTGSSMMPQKRNPDMLELIRGKSALVIGHVTQILTLQKGLPMAYNRDLQEDKRILFDAYDQTRMSVKMMERIVATARLNQNAINQHIDKGFTDATALSEYFVTIGIPFRTAHHVVGALVQQCLANRNAGDGPRRLEDLPLEAFRTACEAKNVDRKLIRKIDAPIYQYLGPANVVKKYQSYGSAGVKSCEEQIAHWHQQLGLDAKPAKKSPSTSTQRKAK